MPKRSFSYKISYVTPKGGNRLAVRWVKSLIFFKKLFTWVRANVAEGSEGQRQKNISTDNRAVGEGKMFIRDVIVYKSDYMLNDCRIDTITLKFITNSGEKSFGFMSFRALLNHLCTDGYTKNADPCYTDHYSS
jgi:hypothetical protein